MTEHGRFHLYPNFPNDKLPAATHTVRIRIWKVNMKKDLHSTQNDRFEKWSQLRKSPHRNRQIKTTPSIDQKYTIQYLLMLDAYVLAHTLHLYIYRSLLIKFEDSSKWKMTTGLICHSIFYDYYFFLSLFLTFSCVQFQRDLLPILVSFGCPDLSNAIKLFMLYKCTSVGKMVHDGFVYVGVRVPLNIYYLVCECVCAFNINRW